MTTHKGVDQKRRDRIRAWLDYYRRRRGWTNQKLAEKVGLAEPTVTNILNGKTTAGLDVLIRMHDNLGESANEMLDHDPPPLPGESE